MVDESRICVVNQGPSNLTVQCAGDLTCLVEQLKSAKTYMLGVNLVVVLVRRSLHCPVETLGWSGIHYSWWRALKTLQTRTHVGPDHKWKVSILGNA